MQKILIGIFAHPDDEAFGVSPTLIKEIHDGATVHLILLTAGENGTNPDAVPNLGEVRLSEWHAAAALMGVTGLYPFGYVDGTLSNQHVLEISSRIQDIVAQTLAADNTTPVEFIVLDENGLTGHIDHIVATRAALHAFYCLKESGHINMSRIRLSCLTKEKAPTSNTNWLYMNEGRDTSDIHEVIDARDYRDKIIQVVRAHHSQRHDGESYLTSEGDQLGMNYFIVKD